jgi:hypothetical protein
VQQQPPPERLKNMIDLIGLKIILNSGVMYDEEQGEIYSIQRYFGSGKYFIRAMIEEDGGSKEFYFDELVSIETKGAGVKIDLNNKELKELKEYIKNKEKEYFQNINGFSLIK